MHSSKINLSFYTPHFSMSKPLDDGGGIRNGLLPSLHHMAVGNTTPGDFRITAVNLEAAQHCFSALVVIYLTPMPSPGSQTHFFTQFIQIQSGLLVPGGGAGGAPGPGADTIQPVSSISLTSCWKSMHLIFIFLPCAFLVNIKDLFKGKVWPKTKSGRKGKHHVILLNWS